MKQRFELPIPPSANNMHRTGNRSRVRYKSEFYVAWIKDAGWMLNQQHPQEVPIACYPVRVTIEWHGGKGLVAYQRDGDNGFKAAIDLLKNHGILVDDSFRYVWEHHSIYGPATDPAQPARFYIEIESIGDLTE